MNPKDIKAINEVLDFASRSCVVCGDNREVTKLLPPKCIDAVVTDIPYGTASETKVQVKADGSIGSFNLDWDKSMPLWWLPEAFRVTKDGGSLLFFIENGEVTTARDAAKAAGWHFLNTFYWVKTNPPPQPRKNFCSGIETAIFCRKPGKILYWGGGGATRNWFASGTVANDLRIHETQKNTDLMRQIVRCLCPKGGLVLDPFAGGCTTGAACGLDARRFIGIELDEEKAANGRARLNPESSLFGPKVVDVVEEALL